LLVWFRLVQQVWALPGILDFVLHIDVPLNVGRFLDCCCFCLLACMVAVCSLGSFNLSPIFFDIGVPNLALSIATVSGCLGRFVVRSVAQFCWETHLFVVWRRGQSAGPWEGRRFRGLAWIVQSHMSLHREAPFRVPNILKKKKTLVSSRWECPGRG